MSVSRAALLTGVSRRRGIGFAIARRVVALLLGPDAASITGQVVDAEGGFRRWTPGSLDAL